MSYLTLDGFVVPSPIINVSSDPTIQNNTLNAVDESIGFILSAPITGTITKLAFATGNITTGGTIDCRVETISAGLFSGTLWDTNTNGPCVVDNTDDNTIKEGTLTAGAVVTAGETFAVRFKAPSGFNGVLLSFSDGATAGFGPPYTVIETTAGAPAYSSSGAICGIYFDGVGWVPCPQAMMFSTIVEDIFNNTDTPDVIGAVFTPPGDCKINAVKLWIDKDGDAVLKVYDTDGVSVLASVTLEDDQPPVTNSGITHISIPELTLTGGSDYRIAVEPSSGTDMTFFSFGCVSETYKNINKGASYFKYTSAKDPSGIGSWTDDATIFPSIGVYISAIDSGSSGWASTF